jgi:hypothetical protein
MCSWSDDLFRMVRIPVVVIVLYTYNIMSIDLVGQINTINLIKQILFFFGPRCRTSRRRMNYFEKAFYFSANLLIHIRYCATFAVPY